MFIHGLGTATPPHRFTQPECWTALQSAERFRQLSSRSQAILKRVLLSPNGVQTRHLALDDLREAFELTPNALHARFSRHAPPVASAAAKRALASAGFAADSIDALLVSTCTGYLCPGLTSYVSEQLGLRSDVLGLDLVGQGCGAAIPNLRAAQALLAQSGCQRVLSVCVEICSAAFYLDDDPGVLISACLFGDGAGALALSEELPAGPRRVKWHTASSLLSADARDYLRFEQRDGMLRNILTKQVPAMAAKHAETVLRELLGREQLRRDQIGAWILHGGGRDVLAALSDRLGLDESQLRWSYDVLREYGNVSSPFVIFVLKHALENGAPQGWWWLSSFGAGFSCHGALLQVQ